MKATFKCYACACVFSHDVEAMRYNSFTQKFIPAGLMAIECPNCKNDYMDCQNLEECIKFANELDKQRQWV